MAFELNISVCPKAGCKVLEFNDISGTYNVSTNPTGYGTPNIAVVDIIESILSVYLNNATVPYIYTFTWAVGVITGYTITKGGVELFSVTGLTYSYPFSIDFKILDEELGIDKITDGVAVIEYEISTADETYVTSLDKFFTCQTDCCVTKMVEAIKSCACNCSDKKNKEMIMNAAIARTMFNSAVNSALSGETADAAETLACVNKLCSAECDNC